MQPESPLNPTVKYTIIIFQLLATIAVYWQVVSHEFLKYDDQIYVVENPHVHSGLTLNNIQWAFTTVYAANWHPITWISHMLDVQLFGMNPAGHLLVNVFLHAINGILLFLLIHRATKFYWRSAVVAALFLLHPLHVESVAWVSERKDVLSTFFGMLSLFSYIRYAEKPTAQRYAGVLLFFVLALMSKPMLVSLPLVMIMFDYWPLQRLSSVHDNVDHLPDKKSIRYLLAEKLPFILLVVASSAVTSYAQYKGSAISSLNNSPFPERVSNALVSYMGYLGKMFWPHKLSVFYPFPINIPAWQPICSSLILLMITLFALTHRKKHPYLVVGWLWYVCTLIPVIGFVRIGLQSMADRYSYIPLIGIFVMSVWGVADASFRLKFRNIILPIVTTIIISTYAIISWNQVGYWKTTQTLFSHAKESTRNNFIAFYLLGSLLEKEGHYEEALKNYNEAVKIAPWYENARVQRDILMFNQGRLDVAAFKYNYSILQNPNSLSDHINLGIILALQDKLEESLYYFKVALELNPQSAEAHYNIAMTLSRMEKLEEAEYHYRRVLSILPDDVDTLNNLGVNLAKQSRTNEAIQQFIAALRRKPDFFDARNNLEIARKKLNPAP